MTKPLLAAVVAVTLLLPAALAHSTPAAREIDTRVLEEGLDLLLDYGSANGLLEDGCGADFEQCGGVGPLPVAYEGGHDLLSLDLREAYGPGAENGTIEPGLWIRLTFRRGLADVELSDVITFELNGSTVSLDMTSMDNQVFTSQTFTYVSEKYEEGTYERGLQAFVPYAIIGAAPGDTLTSISVTSYVDGSPTDIMPGSYYYEGQQAPDTHGTADSPTIEDYVLTGPAALFAASFASVPIDLDEGEQTLPITLTNALAETGQVVQVEVLDAGGLQIAPLGDALLTPGNGTTVDIRVDTAGFGGHTMAVLALSSDLGGRQLLELHANAPVHALDGAPGTTAVVQPGESALFHFSDAGAYHIVAEGVGALDVVVGDGGEGHEPHEGHDAMDNGTDAMDGESAPAMEAMDHSAHAPTPVNVDSAGFDADTLEIAEGGMVEVFNLGDAPLTLSIEPSEHHGHHDDESSGLPGVGALAAIALVGVAAFVARRR